MSTNWADFADDEDADIDLQVELPERTETPVDERGIKKVRTSLLFCSWGSLLLAIVGLLWWDCACLCALAS